MDRDWTGNHKSAFVTVGAVGHGLGEREANDFYATDPSAIDLLVSEGGVQIASDIWEPACGMGHLSERLIQYGYNVRSTDLIDRGYGTGGIDFLKCNDHWNGDILTNPPYKYALDFTKHALDLIDDGRRVFMFLKLSFLESKIRRPFFATLQLEKVCVFSDRIACVKGGDFNSPASRSAISFAWFIFKKGYGKYPEIRWLY